MTNLPLCSIDDIEDPGSIAAVATIDGERVGLMVVRKDGEVFVYQNSCPHIGAPLDFHPGQFLDLEKRLILCSTHGALFRIEDGECMAGPCNGKHLAAVPVHVENGLVFLSPPATARD